MASNAEKVSIWWHHDDTNIFRNLFILSGVVYDPVNIPQLKTIENSSIWEGLFLELKHESLQNKITIGNLYKPPRDNNSARNINAFREELEPIIQELSATNNEVLICGDYNINLLKLNSEAHYSDFFDTMLGHSFYPKISLPTRLNRSSGATLIDNIYCKLSFQTVKTTSGIIMNYLITSRILSVWIILQRKKQNHHVDSNKKWIVWRPWRTCGKIW